MKNTFQKLILGCLLLTATMAANAQFSGSGSGTSIDPYLITNYTQLNEVRNDLTAHYRLDTDVNASSAWVPIGDNTDDATRFTGTFDGNGHTVTISGMGTVPPRSSYYYVGLFGYLSSGATVQNLKIAGSLSFTANYGCYIGGIAGMNDGGTIKNCVVAADIVLSGNAPIGFYAGGIAGANRSTIQNCYSTGDVSADASGYSTTCAGGIAGTTSAGSTLTNCYATGNIEASAITYAWFGGIAGTHNNGTSLLSNCVALNASVSTGSATTQRTGRITSVNISAARLTNNRAIAISSLPNGTLTDINGLLISPTEAQTQSTYETDAGWAFGNDDANPWAWDNTLKRPKLYWEILQGAVAITGATTYGETLTANTGGITSLAPGSFTYQWKRNGSYISGATGNTYTLMAADVGSTITVEVRASNYFGSITSTPTSAVAQKEITFTGTVSATKVYDGTDSFTNAQITITNAGNFSGLVGTDVVTLEKTGVTGGTTASVDVGSSLLSVAGSFTLGGANAGNYVLSAQPTVTATITPFPSLLPVFDNLNSAYSVNDNIPLKAKGTNADKLTTIKVTGIDLSFTQTYTTLPATFIPTEAGHYLIEAISTNQTLRIWKYITVTP